MTGALLGVLDWEEARRGSKALDLAWCEWQFTTRFPIYLSDTALRATAGKFGRPHSVESVERFRVPPDCELMYGAGAIPAWGVVDADRRLASIAAVKRAKEMRGH